MPGGPQGVRVLPPLCGFCSPHPFDISLHPSACPGQMLTPYLHLGDI